ncbi:MAG TPA: threonine--tRNA ligase [Candidatus Parcubacteria bacterium]|nr:threonine--tRNA ligase [Candidatus Parcubacteria bacterium]
MKNKKINTIRHSLAHILAYAVQELYPGTKFGIGPAIENGFYYDFDFSVQIKAGDLKKIEKKMRELIRSGLNFDKKIIPKKEAAKLFKNQPYKLELIKEIPEKSVSVYQCGDFVDLCKGPHIKSSKEINVRAFKLTKIAGAYWKGDEKNKMLARIYGLAFESEKELDKYLKQLAEAEKRDHRVLGRELGLFMTDERIGQGLVMLLPKGAFIYKKLEDYMYSKEFKHGYHYVRTPILALEDLYKKSGHLSHYKDDMYNPIDIDGEKYYLKPMNCPHHHIMFKHEIKSYQQLPYRLSDFGMIHRYERSGTLSGLIRTRGFCQNDAHIYCRRDQVEEEFISVLKLFKEVYKDFQIKDYWFELSLPDLKNKEKYGDIENKKMWRESADIARRAMKKFGAKFVEIEGEAAFYGPKIDVQVKNVFGKTDTIATIQIDFYMPERFDLNFINKKGEKERPVIIHRAIMGSFERFFAFLIEQTKGNFPLWISPIQIEIAPISKKYNPYARKIKRRLEKEEIRVKLNDNDDTLGKKIRESEKQKIPYLLIVGEKEKKNETVSARKRGRKDLGELKLENFIGRIKKEIETKK